MDIVASNYDELFVASGHELEKPVEKKEQQWAFVMDILGKWTWEW